MSLKRSLLSVRFCTMQHPRYLEQRVNDRVQYLSPSLIKFQPFRKPFISAKPDMQEEENIKNLRRKNYDQKQIIHQQKREIQQYQFVVNNLKFEIDDLKSEIRSLKDD